MEFTAYHEAGHGVVAVMLGGKVSGLSIAHQGDSQAGDTRVIWPTGLAQQPILINDIKTALAGPISEMVYEGDYDYLRIRSEHAADWQIVTANLDRLGWEESARGPWLQWQVAQLYEMIRGDSVWSAIADIADLLMLQDEVNGELVHETTAFWLRR